MYVNFFIESPCRRSNPCMNGGTCMFSSSSPNGYFCRCHRNFFGKNCLKGCGYDMLKNKIIK